MSYDDIILELNTEEVELARKQTRAEYPRIKDLVFYYLTYHITVRSDGTGWVKIPKDKVV